MATSGSANISVSANDIAKAILRVLAVYKTGQTPKQNELTDVIQALNMLQQQWRGNPDILTRGLKMWKRKHVIIDLTATAEYTMKFRRLPFTSGGTTAIAVGDTITGDTGGATAVVCSVELSSGTWAGGDAVGEFIILSQVGTFQAEELNTNLATITADSEQYGPPTTIKEAVLRNDDDQDTPMKSMVLEEYMAIGDKTATGSPRKYYYEVRKDEAILRLDCVPSDTTDTIYMVVLLPIEDFDAGTDDPDFPREWFRALKYNGAMDMAPEYGRAISQDLKDLAASSLLQAQGFDPETSRVYFEPDRDD